MKKQIQRTLNSLGYRIERIRPPLPGYSLFILDYLLQILNQQRAGNVSFVQIGANDGLQEDPCHAWINHFQWHGVLVEPQARLASMLREMYRENNRIRIEQSIISDKPGSNTLYYLRDSDATPAWASGIASMDKQSILQHRHKIPGLDSLLAEEQLMAMTFDQLLEKYSISTVDFLQIDCEGLDYQIIKSIDLGRLRPAIIGYEHANLAPEDSAACRSLLASHGYHFASWLGDTVAALPDIFPVSEDRRRYLLHDAGVSARASI
jgi:FkbM family methyltransferase